MTVYVLEGYIDYEGSEFLGVFTDEKEAKKILKKLNKPKFKSYSGYILTPHELDKISPELEFLLNKTK